MGIPRGPDEVTAAWFAEHLGWQVDDVSVTEIGAGLGVSSAVYRAMLSGDAPPSVVVKLTAIDEAAAFTSTVLGMYRREVAFFDQLAASAPVRVPTGHYGAVSGDGADVVIVMEDLGALRVCDQTVAMSMEDARRCVDALADWHAHWWGRTDGLCESGAAVALGDPIYPALLPGLFDEGWAKLCASAGCAPPAPLVPIGERFSGAIAGLLERLDTGPTTVLHGDFRGDNLMFAADDSPVLMDFQLIGTGAAAYDLAYFVTASLDVDAAQEHELFQRWVERLTRAGVDRGELADMWDQYRRAALFCLVYPGVACRGMDLDEPRQQALANTMMARMARAVVDLDLESQLP